MTIFTRWKGFRYINVGRWTFGFYFTFKRPPGKELKGWWNYVEQTLPLPPATNPNFNVEFQRIIYLLRKDYYRVIKHPIIRRWVVTNSTHIIRGVETAKRFCRGN